MSLQRGVRQLLGRQLGWFPKQRRSVHSVGIIGAPFSYGQKRRGVEGGPRAIREAGLAERLSGLGCKVYDYGDLSFTTVPNDTPYNNIVHHPRTVGLANQSLTEAVSRAVGDGHLSIMLGGDHSYILKNFGIRYFSMKEVDQLGIQKVMERTFDHLIGRQKRPVHLSFDVDAIDPSLAPATGTPVIGGLTYREGMYIAEEVHNTGMLSAMDLVEVNPKLATSDEELNATVNIAVDVISFSLGQAREGSHGKCDELPTPSATYATNEQTLRL
ncbi:arginase-2, mitochondrial isoform X4 [Carcharodon carcharias]|uniref:arginase-2, mitochondrial isoform X4 n=1 Tax=Carcharodon carcharias TaxID=13397 RepID=UPI001B7EB0CB|nr:arginase-2, mitochondrial isoform X4 [Carcharodon carcharias]